MQPLRSRADQPIDCRWKPTGCSCPSRVIPHPEQGDSNMRALMVGLSGMIGVLCLSDSAMAQTRNTVTINLQNNTKHSIGLHDVRSRPQAKNWTWSPQTVSRGDKGTFIGYWDDDQAPSLTVEFDGYTSGPYGCHVSCSISLPGPHGGVTEPSLEGLDVRRDVAEEPGQRGGKVEAPGIVEPRPPANWPHSGEVQVDSACLLPSVLDRQADVAIQT